MKTFLSISILILLFLPSIFGQEAKLMEPYEHSGSATMQNINFRNDSVWIRDSIHSYIYENTPDSILSKITYLIEQNTDGKPVLELEGSVLSGLWKNLHKDSIAYFESGLEFEKYRYRWNDELFQWEVSNLLRRLPDGRLYDYYSSSLPPTIHHYHYEYDDSLRLISILTLKDELGDGNYVNYHSSQYYLGENGLPDSMLTASWQEDYDEWRVDKKNYYTWDENLFLVEIEKLKLDYPTNSWRFYKKIDYERNEDGNSTKKLYQNWNEIDSVWINEYQYEYQYTDFGERFFSKTMKWINEWTNLRQNFYIHDEHQNLTFHLNQVWDNEGWKDQWSEVFYWSAFEIVGIDDIKKDGIIVYPNPTTGIINVSFEKATNQPKSVSIFNTMGQRIITKKNTTDNLQIDISNYPSGIYYLRIGDNRVIKVVH